MKMSIFAVLHFCFFDCQRAPSRPTNVVNLSHYDMMRPDFDAMKRQGIVGVIHEATYPPFVRDPKYLDRQMGALQAGLLWGAYHYANGSDPIRQADHFLSVVSNAWAQANPATRPSAGVLLVLDFEKNGHYPGGTMRPEQAVAFVERIPSAHRCVSRHLFGRISSRAGSEQSKSDINAAEKNTDKLLVVDCKLFQGAACDGAVEFLGSVAILR